MKIKFSVFHKEKLHLKTALLLKENQTNPGTGYQMDILAV